MWAINTGSCACAAGFTELERYGEYLALHLGESLDGWWTHTHACNKSDIRSLPHAEGKPDHDYPPYQISNGNQMARAPVARQSHMQTFLSWAGMRAGKSTQMPASCKALHPGAAAEAQRGFEVCGTHTMSVFMVSCDPCCRKRKLAFFAMPLRLCAQLPLGTKTVAMTARHADGTREYDAHNLYGMAETRVTAEIMARAHGRRPFILTRRAPGPPLWPRRCAQEDAWQPCVL